MTISFGVGHRLSFFWASFGASTGKRTSPSTSPQFFALDAAIMRSVRPKIDEIMSVSATKTLGWVQVLLGTGIVPRDYIFFVETAKGILVAPDAAE